VYAGDVYAELGEGADALSFYVSALKAATNPWDWDAFQDRAKDLLEKLGRTGDWADIAREAPRPSGRVAELPAYSTPVVTPPASPEPEPPSSPAPFQKALKIGVNDPCPCGSGKKYKKCCKP
jgi:hypothetical protein